MLCVLWSGLCLQDPLSLRNAGVVRPGIGTSVSHGAFRAVLNAVGFSKVCGCLRKHGERELRLQVGPPLLSTDQAVRVTGLLKVGDSRLHVHRSPDGMSSTTNQRNSEPDV